MSGATGNNHKNENKVEEMVDILSTLQAYVPMQQLSVDLQAPGSDEVAEVSVERMHQLLLGGDQLTVARAEGAERVQDNSQHSVGWLKGFFFCMQGLGRQAVSVRGEVFVRTILFLNMHYSS